MPASQRVQIYTTSNGADSGVALCTLTLTDANAIWSVSGDETFELNCAPACPLFIRGNSLQFMFSAEGYPATIELFAFVRYQDANTFPDVINVDWAPAPSCEVQMSMFETYPVPTLVPGGNAVPAS